MAEFDIFTPEAHARPENFPAVMNERLSPMSSRSIMNQERDVEGGAAIPDIPKGRRAGPQRSWEDDMSSLRSEKIWSEEDEGIGTSPRGRIHASGRSTPMVLSMRASAMTEENIGGQKYQPENGLAPSRHPDSGLYLPALQTTSLPENDEIEPLAEEDVEPGSFDLVAPPSDSSKAYSLEKQSELLFSATHLRAIFDNPTLLSKFTAFLQLHRPSSIPLLTYYLETVKALRGIAWCNALVEALEPIGGHAFTSAPLSVTGNTALTTRSQEAFQAMVKEELPAYIAHVWMQTVHSSIRSRITGTLPAHLRELSDGLAEVFCLTDPSRPDNPIVFASEEFHRTTQYGINYAIGRNCRFLQGPKTNPYSVERLRQKLDAGKEHSEVFLNYRRDGSPFMNLLMIAPLYDSRGIIRYFIGAQVDVSGLVKGCSGLEAFQRVVEGTEGNEPKPLPKIGNTAALRDLSEMLSHAELDIINKHGGAMHRPRRSGHADAAAFGKQRRNSHRIIIEDDAFVDGGSRIAPGMRPAPNGKLSGVYEHYLLVRPYPSLRILFASPSLRLPGILQSHFMSKIGGSQRVRDNLEMAFVEGRGVTARILWLSRGGYGRTRWIHCTPLLGAGGTVGVWMVVLVDDVADTAPAASVTEASSVDSGGDTDNVSLASFAAMNRDIVDVIVPPPDTRHNTVRSPPVYTRLGSDVDLIYSHQLREIDG